MSTFLVGEFLTEWLGGPLPLAIGAWFVVLLVGAGSVFRWWLTAERED